jgi:endoglucanase
MVRITRIVSICIAILLLFGFVSPTLSSFAASSATSDTQQMQQTQQTQSIQEQPGHAYLPLAKFRLQGIDGPYHTQGNLIIGADNKPYLFHGIARDDLEYDCGSDGHYTQQELAYMGTGKSTAQDMYWGANLVRLPLSESLWLYGNSSIGCSAASYQALVKQVVDTLTTLHLNVLLDLQWTDAGNQTGSVGDFAGDAWSMPDQDSVTFWQQIATIYKSYSNVLFEVFNEPHENVGWSCWRSGCLITNDSPSSSGHDHHLFTYQAVGMQTLVNTIRAAGANNLALVAGRNWGFDLSQIPTYHLSGTNIVYDTHPYPYTGKWAANWDDAFGNLSATYPVMSAESGEYDCKSAYIASLLNYFDAHDISWVTWAWVTPNVDTCTYPRINSTLTGVPSPGLGQFVRNYMQTYLQMLAGQEIPVKLKNPTKN